MRNIYQYFKEYGYPTTVMGASFRNSGEIIALAGCDRLTISPNYLEELQKTEGVLERRLQYSGAIKQRPPLMTEAEFRRAMNEDAMATEKLAEGNEDLRQIKSSWKKCWPSASNLAYPKDVNGTDAFIEYSCRIVQMRGDRISGGNRYSQGSQLPL